MDVITAAQKWALYHSSKAKNQKVLICTQNVTTMFGVYKHMEEKKKPKPPKKQYYLFKQRRKGLFTIASFKIVIF